jgi:hypothetical protein
MQATCVETLFQRGHESASLGGSAIGKGSTALGDPAIGRGSRSSMRHARRGASIQQPLDPAKQ